MKSIIDPVVSAATHHPDGIYILTPQRSVSFADFAALVNAFKARLPVYITELDARVLIPMSRTPEHLALLMAVMSSGFLAVPVDGRTPPARIEDFKTQLDTRWVLTAEQLEPVSPESGHKETFSAERASLGIMTSGSTGQVKLVVHSFATLLANARGSNQILPLTGDDRTLQSLPLYHIGGLQQCLRALISKTALVIDGVVEDPEQLEKWGITHASVVATQLHRLIEAGRELPCLKGVLLGGGPCPDDVLAGARALQYPVLPTYGMSETAAQLITQTPDGVQVLPGDEVKLGADGELCVRGDSLLLGYWRNGQLDSARDDKGWFHSGDLVTMTASEFKVVGRCDNRFTSGGHNVQPEEIEAVLTRHPDIAQAIVVPVAHPEFGQVPFAFVKCGSAAEISWQQQVITELKQQLAGYLVPRHFAMMPEIKTLKPRRRDLQQLAEQQLAKEEQE